MAIPIKTTSLAARLISKFEGSETEAYLNPVGVPTICTGMTRYQNGEPVRMGDVCRPSICYQYTIDLINSELQELTKRIPGWALLGSSRQASLLSFAWNVGSDFDRSPDFQELTEILREGASDPHRYEEFSSALLKYTTINGQISDALKKRRVVEGELWNQESIHGLSLKATKDTYLKKATLDPIWLSDQARLAIAEDDVIDIWKVQEIPNDLHNWVWISGKDEKWAAYMPDWEVVSEISEEKDNIDWHDMQYPLGRHLTVGEILQYDPRRSPETGSQEEKNLLILSREFNAIREAWNGPLGVAGGYRPEPFNREMGGESESAYKQGKALDIYPVAYENCHLYRWLKSRWQGGIQYEQDAGIITIDIVNGGRFVGLR